MKGGRYVSTSAIAESLKVWIVNKWNASLPSKINIKDGIYCTSKMCTIKTASCVIIGFKTVATWLALQIWLGHEVRQCQYFVYNKDWNMNNVWLEPCAGKGSK